MFCLSVCIRLGLATTLGISLLFAMLMALNVFHPVQGAEGSLIPPSPMRQNAPPDVFPVITATDSQYQGSISGDCIAYRGQEGGVYLHNLTTGETLTITDKPDEVRKVTISQGVVVWRSERSGEQGLWGYYNPQCSDAGPFTATEVITPFYILNRGYSHAVEISDEMIVYMAWTPAGMWYTAMIELDANNNGVPDAVEPGYDPTADDIWHRLSCCAHWPHGYAQTLPVIYWDEDYKVACWYNNAWGDHIDCYDLSHDDDHDGLLDWQETAPSPWSGQYRVVTDTTLAFDWQGILAVHRDLLVWSDACDAGYCGNSIHILDLDLDDDHILDRYDEDMTATGPSQFVLPRWPWRHEYPEIWQPYVVWSDRGQDIYAYDLNLDTGSDGIPNWKDIDRPVADPAEFRITLDLRAQSEPAIWGNTVIWEDARYGDWDIYGATLTPRVPVSRAVEDQASYWLDQQTVVFPTIADIPGYIAVSGMITRYKSFTCTASEYVRRAWYSPSIGSYVIGYDYCHYGTLDQKNSMARLGRGFTYDQGLALIARTMTAQTEQADSLASYVSSFQNDGQLPTTPIGSFGFSFNGMGYGGEKDSFYDMDYLRLGANAWLGYGLLFYSLQSADLRYLATITRTADYILSHQIITPTDPRYGLFTGGTGRWIANTDVFTDEAIGWVATEHNIDIYFFLRDLGRMTGEQRYSDAAELLRDNMTKLWDEAKGRLNQGMNITGTLNTGDALDAASWGAIYWTARGELTKAKRSLAYADIVYSNTVTISNVGDLSDALTLWGYKLYTGTAEPEDIDWPATDVVWSEGSLGVAMAALKLGYALLEEGDLRGHIYIQKAQLILDEMEKLQTVDANGGLLYAVSPITTLTDFPQAPSVAGTAWFLMVQRATADRALRDAFWGSDSLNHCYARLNDGFIYPSVQAAVNASTHPTDVIKVAGYCSNVNAQGGITQVVYLSKTLTIQGGYTMTDWLIPDPIAHPTTLDAQGKGRVLYISGDISPTIEGLRLTGGDATGLGGGEDARDAGGGVCIIQASVTLSDCGIEYNNADLGGGLYFTGSMRSTLINNAVLSNTAGITGTGGGLCFYYSDGALLAHNLINGNRTERGLGGGLHLENSANVILNSNTIKENMANPFPKAGSGGGGGGISFYNCPNATLQSNIIVRNRASGSGGGNFIDSPGATLIDNIVNENIANHIGGGMKHYAGMNFLRSGYATLMSNTISYNSAANTCGGLCFSASDYITLTNNTIAHNNAGTTGFVVAEGGGIKLTGARNVTLSENTVLSNTAITFGGGLYLNHLSNLVMIDNVVQGNEAKQGGGIWLANSAGQLNGITITANTVYSYPGYTIEGNGGGLYLFNSTAILTNTIIADNEAETAGSGMYTLDSSFPNATHVTLVHTTIANNKNGDGIGLYIRGTNSTINLVNTIVVSHNVGITVAAGNTATLNGVLWYSNMTDTDGSGNIIVTNAHTGDPAFVDPGAGDYHIQLTSVAIDRGVSTSVNDDMDGDSRPQGSGYDLGADETGIAVTQHVTPNPVLAGTQLTYTLHITNTSFIDVHATITDILPSQISIGETSGGTVVLPARPITWTSTIPGSRGVWTETIVVTVEKTYSGTISNVVYVTSPEGATGVATATSQMISPPAIPELLSPPNGTLTNTSVLTLSWQAGTGVQPTGYNVQLDGGVITTTGTTSVSLLLNGLHVWSVRAYNAVGYSDWTVPWEIRLDTVAPDSPILVTPANGTWFNIPQASFTWEHSPSLDVAGYLLNFDALAVDVGYTNQYTTILDDGIYTWTVAAYDTLSNTSSYPAAWSFIVDTSPPNAPTLLAPANNTITNVNVITFTWSDEAASGAVSYTLRLNTIPYTLPIPYSTTVLDDGNYTWTVRALDRAGNISAVTETWQLEVATTSPSYLYLPLIIRE